MFRTINGWTKERMKAQVWARNTGRPAMKSSGICAYEVYDGDVANHCAIGCFIPDGHMMLDSDMPIPRIVHRVYEHMPLDVPGLMAFQECHDGLAEDWDYYQEKDMREVLSQWIDKNVED